MKAQLDEPNAGRQDEDRQVKKQKALKTNTESRQTKNLQERAGPKSKNQRRSANSQTGTNRCDTDRKQMQENTENTREEDSGGTAETHLQSQGQEVKHTATHEEKLFQHKTGNN